MDIPLAEFSQAGSSVHVMNWLREHPVGEIIEESGKMRNRALQAKLRSRTRLPRDKRGIQRDAATLPDHVGINIQTLQMLLVRFCKHRQIR